MRHILITGGAGFVGSHIALGIRSAHPDVRISVLDNFRRRGSELNTARLTAQDVRVIHGDVREPDDVLACGPADTVIECSAEPSVMMGHNESPSYALHTNLTGALHCLEAVRRWDAALLFISTSRVYPVSVLRDLSLQETAERFVLDSEQSVPGISQQGVSEDFPMQGARSLYGATKLAAELIAEEYRDLYQCRVLINRCGLLCGPWQMGRTDQGVVALWAARHLFGGKLCYIGFGGQGKQVRDILHIDDYVRLVLHELTHIDTLDGHVFNVGGGMERSLSLRELTDYCQEATDNPISIGSDAQTRYADIPWYVTDAARVMHATGWTPEKTARQAIHDTVQWMRDHRDMIETILS